MSSNYFVISDEDYQMIFQLLSDFRDSDMYQYNQEDIHFNKNDAIGNLVDYFTGILKHMQNTNCQNYKSYYGDTHYDDTFFCNIPSQEEYVNIQKRIIHLIETLKQRMNTIKQITFEVCQKHAFNESQHCGNF